MYAVFTSCHVARQTCWLALILNQLEMTWPLANVRRSNLASAGASAGVCAGLRLSRPCLQDGEIIDEIRPTPQVLIAERGVLVVEC